MSSMQTKNFIACADLHLRDSVPVNRIDDYWKAQEKKFQYLIDKAIQKKCNILCAGDFFHKARSSAYLEGWTINQLNKLKKHNLKFITITGQHDLPNHNIKEIEKSSIWVLKQAGVIDLYVTAYEEPCILEKEKIMLLHAMIHKDKSIPGIEKSLKSISLLKKYTGMDIIITGDNHQYFYESYKNKYLLNCGSMMRMSSNQIDYIPKFYYIDFQKQIVIEEIKYPIKKNIMDIKIIENEKEKNNRIEVFINKLDSDYEIDLSFEKNLESFFKQNKIRKGVQEKCWEALNEE